MSCIHEDSTEALITVCCFIRKMAQQMGRGMTYCA